MKPSDLFLGFHHFFGYVVPGFVWVTSAHLLFGRHPGEWAGWFPAASIVLASCLVGLLVQDWLFPMIVQVRKRIKWLTPQPTPYDQQLLVATQEAARHLLRNLPVGAVLQEYGESVISNEHFLDQFCKKWVSERGGRAVEELNEQEGAIKFVVGIIPALLVLGVGLASYFAEHTVSRDVSLAVVSVVACVLATAWLFFQRLPKQIESERDLTRNTFLLLILAESTTTAARK